MFNGISCPNKRAVQRSFYSQVDNPKVIGMGGPSSEAYVDSLRKTKKFKDITLYENDWPTFAHQLIQNRGGYRLCYGNILHHLDQDAFYDLDFYCSIQGILLYLPAIFKIDQLMLTVSLRPVWEKYTLETISLFNTTFSYEVYRDSVVPMLTILKK